MAGTGRRTTDVQHANQCTSAPHNKIAGFKFNCRTRILVLIPRSLMKQELVPCAYKYCTPHPLQITESDDLILSPTRPRPAAFVKDDHGHYLLTAYLTKKPQDICKKRKHRRDDDGKKGKHYKEDALVIQMSDVRLCKPQFMEIPLDAKKLANTKWVEGKCFNKMGEMN